ncbi:DUF4838 domain-containing protein [Gaoshiqia sp. Z1-71]|uniref:DUF4838 domain-containing protein n=1 Tax=Gaoshiqia hydrogeniformans TaxID=3290090 RepID=UPI003BF81C8B
MRSCILVIFNLLLFTACSVKHSGKLHLVADGKSTYTIVLPVNASHEEIRAANFLNYHIHEISGCRLPIVQANQLVSGNNISISKSTDFENDDDYSVKTEGSSLFIYGGNAKGCIYGVTEILGKYLGVRYYSPDFVVIPKSNNVSLPALNFNGKSTNTYRNVYGSFTINEYYKDFNRLHTIDDMFAAGFYVHTFHRLVPWTEYFHTNPEYFAWMNGKHIIDQICLSNSDVFDIVINRLRYEMEFQPDKKVWSVSQDDNFSYCQCDECSKVIEEEKSPAGPIIRFVNRVAEQFPDKVISTLAYQYSRPAPVITKPRENVQIMLCTIELNRSQNISADPTSASFLKDMEDWGKISNHIYLWDYTVNFNHHISPFPNLHTLQPNIQLFVSNNVKEHFQQSNTGTAHEFSELKSYLLAKLLWNPDANKKEIIREFTDGYYGKAGKWIRKYIDALEKEIIKTGERLDIYGPPTQHQHTFLSEKNIEQYNQYFDKAEKAVSGQPEYLLHVRTARMALQYAIMEIGKSDMFGARGWYHETNGEYILRPNMVDMLELFYQTSIECKSAMVNEAGLTAEEYYTSTKRFIDVQVKGNLAFRKKVTASPLPSEMYSNGDLSFLTNGVRGASDYKVHWLGWEAKNFSLVLDLENPVNVSTIEISTLWDQKSWILHPQSVSCLVSETGDEYVLVEKQVVSGDQRKEEVQKLFKFKTPGTQFRYVKFEVEGTLLLPYWHPSAGGSSWVFVDEIVVR